MWNSNVVKGEVLFFEFWRLRLIDYIVSNSLAEQPIRRTLQNKNRIDPKGTLTYWVPNPNEICVEKLWSEARYVDNAFDFAAGIQEKEYV